MEGEVSELDSSSGNIDFHGTNFFCKALASISGSSPSENTHFFTRFVSDDVDLSYDFQNWMHTLKIILSSQTWVRFLATPQMNSGSLVFISSLLGRLD